MSKSNGNLHNERSTSQLSRHGKGKKQKSVVREISLKDKYPRPFSTNNHHTQRPFSKPRLHAAQNLPA